VQQGIEQGAFVDGVRMEKLDVIFAKHYIEAWRAYQQGAAVSKSWNTTFQLNAQDNLTVLQHLVLGISTHINLDLAVAAAETAPGDAIADLETDFNKINEVIASLTNDEQARLEKIWWPMRLLRRITNNRDEAVVNFSIGKARQLAWANAVILAGLDSQGKEKHIQTMDTTIAQLNARIARPGGWMSYLLKAVRWFEEKNVGKVISLLK